MRHQRIALPSLLPPQKQHPLWRLYCTCCNTSSKRCKLTIFFCHGGAKRCLEEVKIGPIINSAYWDNLCMMCHQHIALMSLPLLQRQQPLWRLCCTCHDTRLKQCKKTMFFFHGGAKRCLEEVKIAPPCNLLCADWTWCYVVTTHCHQPTTLGTETIQTDSTNHKQSNGMVSRPGRVG
jgi:hypothetical protein